MKLYSVHYLIEFEWRIYIQEKEAIIGPGNDLSPARHKAITWTNDGLLSVEPLEQTSVTVEAKYKKKYLKNSYKCRLQNGGLCVWTSMS